MSDWMIPTVMSGAMLGYYIWSAIEGWAALRWPVVRGTIISSKVELIRGTRLWTYSPSVEYLYSVSGTKHIGTRLRFGDWGFSFQSSAQARLARYTVGTSVQVHYHPDGPLRSVLEPGLRFGNYLKMAFWGAVLVTSVGGIIGIVH